MAFETVRHTFHQVSPAFQTLGGSYSAESRGIRRKTRGLRVWLRNSEMRERSKEKNQNESANARLGRAETHGTTSVFGMNCGLPRNCREYTPKYSGTFSSWREFSFLATPVQRHRSIHRMLHRQ